MYNIYKIRGSMKRYRATQDLLDFIFYPSVSANSKYFSALCNDKAYRFPLVLYSPNTLAQNFFCYQIKYMDVYQSAILFFFCVNMEVIFMNIHENNHHCSDFFASQNSFSKQSCQGNILDQLILAEEGKHSVFLPDLGTD